MSLLEIKTVANSLMTINLDDLIAVVDERLVEGFKPEIGKTVLYVFGGLALRTNEDYDKIKDLWENFKKFGEIVEGLDDKED